MHTNGQRREIVISTDRPEKAIRAEIQQNAMQAQSDRLRGLGVLASDLDQTRETLWEELRACLAGRPTQRRRNELWAEAERVYGPLADQGRTS